MTPHPPSLPGAPTEKCVTAGSNLRGEEREPRPCVPRRIDDEAFARACDEHLDQVWRQLRAMGVAEACLDDAAQEVFLIAYRKLSSFEGRARLSTWLYAITYRVGSNVRRKARRTATAPLEEADHRGYERDPEQALEDKQAAMIVQRFCDGLSIKLRDVFVLCLLEGQPVTEVATLLGLPVNTVHSRVRLVRQAFRKALSATEERKP